MKTITYRDALKEALAEEMERDEAVFLMGEDIAEYGGAYKVTDGLFKDFGKDRIRNTPISEEPRSSEPHSARRSQECVPSPS